MSRFRFFHLLTVCILVLVTSASLAAPAVGQGKSEAVHLCNHGKWATLAPVQSPTVPFASQKACVAHVENGGGVVTVETAPAPTPMPTPIPTPMPADADGDGVADNADNCATATNPSQEDADGDAAGDACDGTPYGPDDDGDGVPNGGDNCAAAANPDQADSDGNGSGDACDIPAPTPTVAPPPTPEPTPTPIDSDGDGLTNDQEAALGTSPWIPDSDRDGVRDSDDNCPTVPNGLNQEGFGQWDSDMDGIGDACDGASDADGDGLSDQDELALGTKRYDADTDDDGFSDGYEVQHGLDPLVADSDRDGMPNTADNCPAAANPDQRDVDADGVGDACDSGDYDYDDLSDQDETNIYGTDPATRDTDADRWSDGREVMARTDPLDSDTDGDGIIDSYDPYPLQVTMCHGRPECIR